MENRCLQQQQFNTSALSGFHATWQQTKTLPPAAQVTPAGTAAVHVPSTTTVVEVAAAAALQK